MRILSRILIVLVVLVVIAGVAVFLRLTGEEPQEEFASIEEYFKYGSIGTEKDGGVPYWIWQALPKLFPEYLPRPGGYAALGLPWERGHAVPVGLSQKTIGFSRVGINCAFCHTATVRPGHGMEPQIYPGGPGHTFDVLAYQRFLFAAGSDPRFNGETLVNSITEVYDMPFFDRLLYKYLIVPGTKKALVELKEQFSWTDERPDWGRGRIDPFNPVKISLLGLSVGDTIGNSDMVPIWNLAKRDGMVYHWDGLNTNLKDVFVSSAVGDGATPETLDVPKLDEMATWLRELEPPAWPYEVNEELRAAGEPLYQEHCASCHAFGGERTGQVIPLAEVGTDPYRAEMWTQEAADAYNGLQGYGYTFSGFQAPDGYVAVPLDGLWIRAPYLHNGSVPSLVDLLEKPDDRPDVFYRGYDVYDPPVGGFLSSGPEAEYFGWRLDTSEAGNSNAGHLYGTDLMPDEKSALVEYLKTL